VAMMVVLLGPADEEFCLRPDHVDELARLGVTNVALLRDQQTVGIVLEGWLFDPARSARAAAQAVDLTGGRTLHPVMHVAVSNAAQTGGAS
jgi:hypothetical protein